MKVRWKLSMMVLLGFCLVWISGMFSVAFAEEGSSVIRVEEAIANNHGSHVVEGYIVGTSSQTSYLGSGHFQSPFSVETNLLLADDPRERDISRLLPVQLPQGDLRKELNLKDHPENLGKKIQIKGDLVSYFSVPGLKNPSAYQWGKERGEAVSIAEARKRSGETLTTTGVVNVDNGRLQPGKLSVYMQDQGAGIQVFSHDPDRFPELHQGDRIQVTGQVGEYNQVTQIQVDSLEVMEKNQRVVAEPVSLSDYGNPVKAESLEGRLVTVKGYLPQVPPYSRGGANLMLMNEAFHAVYLRVWESTGVDLDKIEQGQWFNVTGISSQYRDNYQILPRSQEDIQVSDEQKESPIGEENEVEGVVERVVDGDTIRLKNPVLGANNVRFLNVDTPETNHKVEDERDQSQMDHGKRATAYLQTLISPGDTVTLQLGEEPLDGYGRLLAQVIRKSDGLNTNLEMVRKGYAVTYFIWPFPDQDVVTYSQALKEAKSNKKGIWNPEDRLLELPFVFRARQRGEELFRPVGDFETKEYVEPVKWQEIPDESRVFFQTEKDAEKAGYRLRGGAGLEKRVRFVIGNNRTAFFHVAMN